MQKLLLLLYSVLLFSACENYQLEDVNNPSKGNVTIKVDQIGDYPYATYSRAESGAICTHLIFAMYDSNGKLVKQINQTSDMDDYGEVQFSLDEGNYRLVVLGHSSKSNPTLTNFEKIQFTNATGYSDTFLASGEITVGSEPLTFSITLDRITALCRFVINDDYPENISKIQFYYTGGSGAFDATTQLGVINSKQTVTFDVTKGQKQFDLYTFLYERSGSIDLKVTAYDAENNVLKEREFTVPMYFNEITWVQGAFFEESDFNLTMLVNNIMINAGWDGERYVSY